MCIRDRFQTILDYIPAPEGDPDAETQVLISTIDYNEYVGRIGVGKIDNGYLKVNQDCVIVNHHEPDKFRKVKIGKLYEFEGLNKVEVQEAKIGSIVAISGIADIHIGDTLCSPEKPEAIPFQKISEPTISMDFMVNDSPLAGQELSIIHIYPEKLYYNMVEAKATWLYELPQWDAILTEERRTELYREQKASGTVRNTHKIYPNDPCPCGSGKKYKKCCGKNK